MKLTTEQLIKSCGCKCFLGVFPLDKLPTIPDDGAMFIVNTDTSNLRGQHWIAVKENQVFDPLGSYYPTALVKHMYQFYDVLDINYESYQNPMDDFSCGYFCLYFLHYLTMDLLPNAFDYNLRVILSASSPFCHYTSLF